MNQAKQISRYPVPAFAELPADIQDTILSAHPVLLRTLVIA